MTQERTTGTRSNSLSFRIKAQLAASVVTVVLGMTACVSPLVSTGAESGHMAKVVRADAPAHGAGNTDWNSTGS
ncbi:hypothetical protein KN815_00400 [Streptomyces sp. 4503]|uniref:Uncharacterized protein n=1 Tax=Streptomyces niphimycinicus TaxID=2842201 RepID=A0ABS6C6V4_9ACTN|nr:hypothetical protein [Streptomyces niphimycinicus]MBU3862631.1 hypothetical protein [Streptomyces niphimycinicus]